MGSTWRVVIFSGGCLSFQIQAFDPELWVWGRDRALLSENTEPKVGLKEGQSVSSQVQREGFVASLRNPRNPMAGPTLIVPLPITSPHTEVDPPGTQPGTDSAPSQS